MKNLKRVLRLASLIVLIILASTGAGISGGIAIPLSRKKEDDPPQIELTEFNKEDQETDSLELFKT